MSVTRKSTEEKYFVEMVGRVSHQILGAKLPSNRQVLQMLLFNTRIAKISLRDSELLVINAVLIFWAQARIPTREKYKCANKLNEMYDTLRNIQKTKPERRSVQLKQEAENFNDCLDDLFDIAAADAMDTIRIQEDKDFLTMQRQKGRPGL